VNVFFKNNVSSLLLGALFLVAPFYTQSNLGGAGFDLPYNIAVWAVASWVIALAIYCVMSKQVFTLPTLWPYMIAFPSVIVLNGILISEAALPDQWLFKQLYLIGGVFFLFGLFQFELDKKVINRILYVVVMASGLHALIGTVQISLADVMPRWIPMSGRTPVGMFQQVNVHASFLATGILISLYLITESGFGRQSKLYKSTLIVVFSLAFYIVIASGSRVGLLALILAVPLLIFARWNVLKKQKSIYLTLLLATLVALVAGQAGLERTLDKSAQLTGKSYSTARVAMYSIGLEIVAKNPLLGHGIGRFLASWNPQASDFYNRHPETELPKYVTHPHNEVLLWLIEGGLLAVMGLLVFTIGIFIALYRNGMEEGAAITALLVPISLHTQVELPFYISSLHWFLWLFMLFIALKVNTQIVTVNLSGPASRLIHGVNIVFIVTVTLFLFNTARAQTDIYDFVSGQKVEGPYLAIALKNLYSKRTAQQMAMRSNLYAHIEADNKKGVDNFVMWAEDYVNKSPELKMYEDLISASVYLNPAGKGCDRIKEALTMFAHNKPLQKAKAEKCD
jgi:O-antigen polymerase